jgi:hypothetical protein
VSAAPRVILARVACFAALGALAGCGRPQELECSALEKKLDTRAVETYQVPQEKADRMGDSELVEAKREMSQLRNAARDLGRDVAQACRLGTLPPELYRCYSRSEDAAGQLACDIPFNAAKARWDAENEAKRAIREAKREAKAAAEDEAGDDEGDGE